MDKDYLGKYSLPFLFLLILASCSTVKPYYGKSYRGWRNFNMPDAQVDHTVYLIGDGGDVPTDEMTPLLKLLRKNLRQEPDSASTVIFLGDNIYERGLPEASAYNREEKEDIMKMQMDVTQGYNGRIIIIPGNHDWDKSGPEGLLAVNRQEELVEEYLKDHHQNVFLPDNGCPGPVEISVNEHMTIIVFDVEWWLRKYDKPRAPENGCGVEDRLDFFIQLEDMIRRNDGKHVLLATHHPVISNGNHGGHFNFMDNIFPLRLVRDHLYVPLPAIGSLYPILRKSGASSQDIPSSDFQDFKKAMMSIIEQRSNITYVAGHDHNLQMHKEGLMNEIISGAASKSNFAARGFGAAYVQQTAGFARLVYYKNGQVWVEFYTANEEHPEGILTFRSSLYSLNPEKTPAADKTNVPDYTDSVKVMAANPEYDKNKIGQFFFGKHYREEWTTPVKVPYIDLKSYKGGLTPIKKGGGKQTISIRFIDDDSVQYNLRSIDKFPAGAIPDVFRDTWVNDFVKDQISTAHPYGALAVPDMAEAIGIYHTEPELYYTPFTPYLGPYINDFGGRMGLMEIRPDEDLSAYKRFGFSKNVVSTTTLFEHLKEDNDNEVDADMYLKSRFFDMLIGDWDRHNDQWRWAEYEKEDKGSIFRPVPRDRDQVFVLYDGAIPWLLSRKWAFRNFSDFDYDISDIKGLNRSAINLDHALLSELDKDAWMSTAKNIQKELTDEVIDKAVKQLPEEVYPFSGPEIAAKLKSRRDHLQRYASEYYNYLSKEVNVVGSDKHEYVKVERLNDDETRVQMFKTFKGGEVDKSIYDRTFYTYETDEIRIFGRDGEDKVEITGKVNDGILIRVVGGKEKEDEFIDESSVAGLSKKTIFYDNKDNEPNMKPGKETRVITSKHEWVNAYERDSYQYNYTGPRLFVQYNVDDGLYLGGGAKLVTHGFRKDPFKASHSLLANYAVNTGAFNFQYEGVFSSVLGHHWDVTLDAKANGPKYVFNYFGQGNETENDRSIDYYRIHMNSIKFKPAVVKRFSSVFKVGAGPNYEYIDVEENSDNILATDIINNPEVTRGGKSFLGFNFFTEAVLADHPVNPEKGMKWRNEINYYNELDGGFSEFTQYSTDLSVYFTPNLPIKVTFASRVGAATNVGDYYFYHSNFVGNLENLRGFRRTRFAGKTSFYNNNEVRFKLFRLRNNLINGNFGLFGFFDQGRVWSKEGSSNKMHRSYGPGVYLHFFEVFLLSGSYGISDEDQLFTFKAGFLF
ncbi:metallophosphoesterase [Fulvivirga maritima]|uniref:ShlB/FhaC/HecB family hemolysin secretion/activation protein n=1 Tax=Fulvivirga maritima TaxID=2904247 RepID=UPI001F1A906C|nr:ShlB/FhaC/HecB family hemolysin secretion/activation protein [Fulvivirga maritima]UII26472.1 metallophosphoesterase [Fulvivirga maritima]